MDSLWPYSESGYIQQVSISRSKNIIFETLTDWANLESFKVEIVLFSLGLEQRGPVKPVLLLFLGT
jgi:hypothetical protein